MTALVIGALYPTNAWDLPTFALPILAAVMLRRWAGWRRALVRVGALAIGADGVHLRGEDVSAREVGAICDVLGLGQGEWVCAVSCHSVEDVRRAEGEGASLAVLGPIFGKPSVGLPGVGLETLRVACRGAVPVLALGGVTVGNARSCMEAGASGVAGIRLFQDGDIFETVRELKFLV